MNRSPKRHDLSKARRVALLLSSLLNLVAFLLPWVEIRVLADVPGIGRVLEVLGKESNRRALRGYEIPRLASATSDDALYRIGAAASEVMSGALDRAYARALFGERYEELWAYAALVPPMIGLLGIAILFGRGRKWLYLGAGVLTAAVAGALVIVSATFVGESGGHQVFLRAGTILTILALVTAAFSLVPFPRRA